MIRRSLLHWLAGAALVMGLQSAPALAQVITFDSASSAASSGTTTLLTWSHTVGAGSGRILIVGVSIRGIDTVTALTYGSQSLTQIGSFANGGSSRIEMWSLLAPTTGTATISVTLSAAANVVGGGVSYSNVNQTTPLGTFVGASGNSTAPSVTVTSAVDELVVDTLSTPGDAISVTVGAGQTQLWNEFTGTNPSNVRGAGSSEAGAASVTMSWTLGATRNWAIGAVPLQPSGDADLSLAKAVDDATPNVGSNVVFTLTLSNAGPATANGVQVTDLLPSGYTYVSDDGGGAYVSGTGVWTVASIASGGSATLNITATVNASGSYSNYAEVTASNRTDPDSTLNNASTTEDDDDTVSTTPVPIIDLSLTKIVDDATPNVGTNVVFTITVANGGPSDATGVVVTDLLPAGYTYVSDTPSQGAYVSGTGVWTVGAIAAAGSATLDITATVLAAGPYANSAEVTAAVQTDSDSTPGDGVGDDFDSETPVPVPIIDLSVTKTVDNATPNVGTNVVFTITVANGGPSGATGVVVTDLLPAGYTYVSDVPSQGAYVSGTGVWTVGAIANGGSATLDITATVLAAGPYANSAEVTAAVQTDSDSTPGDGAGDDYDTETPVPVPIIDLSVTKTVDNPTPNVGTNVVFTITVANAGPSGATGVVVTDLLPAGYSYVSDVPSQGAYVSGTGVWTVGAIANGGSATLDITATVLAAGPYLNAAEVTAAGQTDSDSTPGDGVGDDFDSETLVPVPIIDLSLTKTVDNPTPNVGTNVVFTITVANGGPSGATGVVVTDLLPAGYTYVSDVPSQGAYVSGTGVWTVGAIANGGSATLDITATVLAAGPYANSAEVTAAVQTDSDSTPGDGVGDDFDSETPVPVPIIDLSVTKTVDNPTPNVGTNVVFTITVANGGPSGSTGVVVTDLLPAGYTYVSDVPSQGAYVSGTGVWTVGAIANGGSATLDITATVLAAGPYLNAAEVTAAVQTDSDSTPGDGAGDDFDSEAPVPVPIIDLSLTKTVDNPGQSVGSNVVFTLTVSNAGPSNATGVVVTDLLPAGYTYVSDVPSQGAYVSGTGVWTVGAIANGGSATLDITATVLPAGPYLNTAEVTAAGQTDSDSTPGNGSEDDYATRLVSPGAVIDLSVTKVIDNATPNVGTNVVFTITVANGGPSNATGVVVTDLLPAGYSYVSDAPSQGAYVSGTGVWTVGGITSGSSATLDITATVLAAGPYTNNAQVTSANEADSDSSPSDGAGDDFDSETPVPVPIIDLSVTKVIDNATPNVGTNVVFTITVANGGPSGATGVVVTDLLPAGYSYVSDTPSQGAYVSGTGVWTVGAVANGGSATLGITATVLAAGPYANSAQVTAAGQTDSDSTPGDGAGDDFDSETPVPVPIIDLSVTKVVDDATPNVGTNVVFTITVANGGPSNATGVVVTDLLPAGYTYVSDTPSQGAYVSGTGVWTVGAIANGGSAALDITATVLAAGPYANSAEVTAAVQTDSDSTPGDGAGDDFDSETPVPVPIIDLSVNKIVDNPGQSVGSNVVFTITVSNAGPSNATGVVVTDLLPAGFTYVSDVPSQGAYVSGTGVWTVGAIANGGSATLDITATVLAAGPYVNAAEVTAAGQIDSDSTPGDGVGDDYDTALVTPGAVIDLSLTKTVDNATPNVGTNVVFTITVANGGPSGATGVVVTDLLPAGYTYVSDTPSQGAYVSGTGVWTVGAIANGGSATLDITATVLAAGPYLNAAEVTAANEADSDSTPGDGAGDDRDTETPVPVPIIDLSLIKVVDNATPNVGTNVVFTITVANGGPSGATGVVVTDLLPAGYTYVSDVPSQGAYVSGTGVWTVGAIANGGSATLDITATVLAAGPYANSAQVAAAGQTDSDSTPGDGAGDDFDSETPVPIPIIDLSVNKIVDNPGQSVGSNVVFTITVSNAGPSNATGVVVTDLLPAGFTYVSDVPSQGAYVSGTGVWTVGAIANASSATLTITATVLVAGPYLNAAEVTTAVQTDSDSTPGDAAGDDYDTALVTPGAVIDLSLTKTVDNATPNVGTNVVFTITVANGGPSGATGVVVTDLLPTGYTYVSNTPSQGAYVSGTGVWTVGAIANGGSATLDITATVLAAGPYVNAAEVTAANEADSDSTPGDGAGDDRDTETPVPVPIIDLSLTKVVDDATPNVGTNVVFTITVANGGPSGATGVVVTDLLPAGYTYLSNTPSQGAYVSGTGVWTVGAIANGGSATLDITATVLAAGPYANSAQVTAAVQTDSDSTPGDGAGDDFDSETPVPVPIIDLSLTKVVDDATPNVGTNVVFTITVANGGPSGATGVVVTDLLPAGYTYVSDTPSQGAYVSGTGVWTVGAIAAAGSATLDITATVLVAGPYLNAAEVTAAVQNDSDSTPGDAAGDDYDTALVTPGAVIDLSVTKTVDNATPNVGTNVVFTITVANGGPSGASGVVVTDLLPAGYTYVSDTPSQGAYVSGTGVWTVGAIANGGSATLDITATVLAAGPYLNAAEVTAAVQTDSDSTPGDGAGDDRDTETPVPVPIIDLSLAKIVDDATPNVGTNVVFTVTVANGGPSGATGVVVTDLLPAGYSYVSNAPSQGAYVSGTGVWTVGAIANGGSATLGITATVLAAGPYANSAQVTAAVQTDSDSTPGDGAGDDFDSETPVPVATIDLSLNKSVDNATPNVGTNVTFTVTVANAGPSNATGVVVTDPPPAGYTYVSDTPSQGAYVSGTGVWTVGAIANGGSATLDITATVLAAGPYLNAAEVTAAGQTDSDSTPGDGAGDDRDTQTTTPTAVADLSLTKSVSNPAPNVGANITFTLTVSNAGPSSAAGVQVTDLLPSGYTFVSAAGPGTYNSGTGVWSAGAVAAVGSAVLTITATVDAAGVYTNTAEVSAMTGVDPDSTPANGNVAEDDYAQASTAPVAAADLSLSKTVSNTAPPYGTNVTFTLTVSNAGPSAATGVEVTDLLPTGYTYVSDTGGGAYNSGTGVWTVGALAATGSASLGITATVNVAGVYNNTAEITAAGEADPDSTPGNGSVAEDDDAQQATTPNSRLDISIAADTVAVRRGEFILYTVTIFNPTGIVVPAVSVQNLLPAGASLVAGTVTLDGVAQPDPAAAIPRLFPIGAFNPAETHILVYRAVVNSGAALGELDNRVVALDAFATPLSRTAHVTVAVIEDPEFDLGTIIGKVFEDRDGNGLQNDAEPGIAGAMVAMEDGVYAITDPNGMYHIAAVRPGNRLVKINRHTLPVHDALTLPEAQSVTMTPGLLVKVNFGVKRDKSKTTWPGRPGTYGISVAGEKVEANVEVQGNLDDMTAVINGVQARLPKSRVKMDVMSLETNLRIVNGKLERPATFNLVYPRDRTVKEWTFEIFDSQMRRIRGFRATSVRKDQIVWDGRDSARRLVQGGAIYQYQLTIEFTDGSLSKTPLRMFGVNRTNAISFELTGASFETNTAVLNDSAVGVLKEIADTLRKYPDEKVVVRGHTDSSGDPAWNAKLSLRRAEAVQAYLIAAGINPERLVVEGRGAETPVASNNSEAGRARNRRVEIKALLEDTERARTYASSAGGGEKKVIVNGQQVEVDEDGSFRATVDSNRDRGRVYVGLQGEDGGVAAATVSLPSITILEPTVNQKIEIGKREDVIRLMQPRSTPDGPLYPSIKIPVRGRTEAGNQVFIDGEPVEVAPDGNFKTALPLAVGENTFGVVAIGPNGYTSLVNLAVSLSGVDKNLNLVTVRTPMPQFSLDLPPAGAVLSNPNLFVGGKVPRGAKVTINTWSIPVAADGTVGGTVRLPEGPSVIETKVSVGGDSEISFGRPVTVDSNHFFIVALGDATVNKISTDGAAPGQFEDDLFVDGRVALYAKGRIKGKYLMTAGLDTGDGRLSEIGSRLNDRDNRDFYRNLDPDAFYPVYGDASRTVKDTNSQGRFYVLLEAPNSTYQWGNYNSGITGNEFASFNRSLYGAKGTWKSLRRQKTGEPMGEAIVFAALPETRSAHDEFDGTGGSLYFLRNKKVVPGSEKVRFEVRDKITGIPVANVTRRNYVDYEIDYAEGRMLFRAPVSSVADTSTIISDGLLNGNRVMVVVDYEYTDLTSSSLDDSTYGGRVKHAVGENLTLGATYVQEDRATGDYSLQGGDVTIRAAGDTKITMEFSQSENEALAQFSSTDGGLSFAPKTTPLTGDPANAYRFELATGAGRARVTTYFRHLDAGFSSSFSAGQNETDQQGATLALKFGENGTILMLVDNRQVTGVADSLTGTLQVRQEFGRFGFSAETRYRDTDNAAAPDTSEGIAALRLDFRPSKKLGFFGRLQRDFIQQIDGVTADRGSKQQATLGVNAQITEGLSGRAEFTTGEQGDSALLGLTSRVDEHTTLYGTYTMSPDQAGGRTGVATVGATSALSDRTRLYTEEQFRRNERENAVNNVVGVSTRLSDRLTAGAAIERSNVEGNGATPDTLRQAASAHISFVQPRFKLSSKFEIRRDDSPTIDRDQWLTANAIELKWTRDLTLLGRFSYGVTTDNSTGADENIFREQSVGFAFRPVAYDWLNVLTRYTEIRNLPPGSQIPAQDETTDQILSFQTVIDLHRRLTLTEKFAVRDHEVDQALLSDLKSRMKLWINRFSYHLGESWDAALEYRSLQQDGAGDNAADGFLFEVNRLFFGHMRVGVGYNLTDFTDNEFSANDYSARGMFFRIQGKY